MLNNVVDIAMQELGIEEKDRGKLMFFLSAYASIYCGIIERIADGDLDDISEEF